MQSRGASARPRRHESFRSQLERLPRFGRDQRSGYAWLRDNVLPRISSQISDCLLRHVVDVAHVVLEAGDAPPEAERVGKAGGALAIECRSDGSVRFYGLQLVLREVARSVELLDLGIERREGLEQMVRRGLATYCDRPGVIESPVIHPHSLPQAAVDQSLLELRAWIVQNVRKNVRGIC